MGEPENPEEFVRSQAGEITVYISKRLLQERLKPGTRQMFFYIDGYGRHTLTFDPPYDGKV